MKNIVCLSLSLFSCAFMLAMNQNNSFKPIKENTKKVTMRCPVSPVHPKKIKSQYCPTPSPTPKNK